MTTFKGAMRSFGAAVRRMEREQQRRNRVALREFKLQQKQAAIENAAEAVRKYTDYLELLQAIHKDASEKINWKEVSDEPAPEQPVATHDQEEIASEKLNEFSPVFFDKLLGLSKGKIRKLEKAVDAAKQRDQANHDTRVVLYQKELAEWEQMQAFAKGLSAHDTKQYKEVLSYFNPFSDVAELGSEIRFRLSEESAELDLLVKSDEVIPKVAFTLTSTGKLSQKNIPISRFNEIYQDYVCSGVLKVARETCALLPVKFVIVNAMAELLNPVNGRIEEQVILSVAIFPETLEKIDFEHIDPSDCMRNFKHNMRFKKADGFIAVDPIESSSLL
jgi:hypothetical protein